MTKYVIGPDTSLYLADHETVIAGKHEFLAPTLLRSQVSSLLYRAVGEKEAPGGLVPKRPRRGKH